MSRRLVDANDCVKDLQHIRGVVKSAFEKMMCDFLINKIDAMPDVDAVAVIRCKDCHFRVFDRCAEEYWCDHPSGLSEQCKDTDYCSYGERRINER